MLEPTSIPVHKVLLPSLEERNITLLVKRLDMIHPEVSGNKFYKLKYNLHEAQKLELDTTLTFGGAFSNHILATAEAARLAGMKSIGVIRGEKPKDLNPTLAKAEEKGMLLHYISREQYRNKKADDFIEDLKRQFGRFYLVPEGGTNALAIKGTSEILNAKDLKADIIACSIGTGGTIAGLLATAELHQEVWGFSSLKGEFMKQEIEDLLEKHSIRPKAKYKIFTNYHFGGYAKHTQNLVEFISSFNHKLGIPLDPIYTGKMMFGLLEECRQLENKTVLCLHTGGLQGIEGFNKRYGTNLKDR